MAIFSWIIETLLQWYVWMPLVAILLYATWRNYRQLVHQCRHRKHVVDSRNTKG